MKSNYWPYSLILLSLITACNSPHHSEDVVCETYVHRYGVPLDEQEWASRGQHGQIVTTRKDGVVVDRSYDYGVLHGETTYTFPHRDAIEKREFYDQGALKQEVWNYPNGIPQRQFIHHSPTTQTNMIWYENGAPQCKEDYENERLMRGEYFDLSNQLESRIDEANGIRTRRDGYGQLLSVDQVQEGCMNLRTTYHPGGSPESVTPYVNEKSEGQRRTFLPSGEPNTIEEWQRGCQHGNTVVFQNGEKYADVPYRNGVRQGIERRYRNGEALVEEVTWDQDQMHGPCHSYVGGGAKKTSWYVQGREVNKATYDAYQHQQ